MQQETKGYGKKQKLQQEEAKKQKQHMQQQYVEQMHRNKQNNQASPHYHHVVMDQKPQESGLFKEQRKKRKKAEAQLRKQKERQQSLKQTHALLQKKHDYLKEVVYEEKKENEQLKQEIAQLKEEKEVLQKEKEALSLQVNDHSHEKYLLEKKKWTQEKGYLEKQNQELLLTKKRHVQSIQGLQRKVKLLEGIQHAEKKQNIEEKLLHIQRELQFYKQKVSHIEQTFSAQTFIEKLQQNLSIHTVDQYLMDGKNPFGPLGADVSRMLKLQKEHEETKQDHPSTEEPVSLFGYIGKTKTGWVFFDLNYHSYEIVTCQKGMVLQEEKPAKAIVLADYTVHIHQAFDIEPTEMQKTRQKRKQNLHKTEEEPFDYPFFGNQHVLVIGSRNQVNYTQRLAKHGLSVQWHNPFEEGYKRLSGKYQKADVVIVCTRHIPHAVLDHIDKKCDKVELLERDNEEMLASRVSYVLLRLQKTNT